MSKIKVRTTTTREFNSSNDLKEWAAHMIKHRFMTVNEAAKLLKDKSYSFETKDVFGNSHKTIHKITT